MPEQGAIDKLIIHDEIGLASGLLDDVRIRSVYRTVFARRGEFLLPVAIEASAVPTRQALPLEPRAFLAGLDPVRRDAAAHLATCLAIANFALLDNPSLPLVVNVFPRWIVAFDPFLADIGRYAGEAGLDPRGIIFSVNTAGAVDPAVLVTFTNAMRSRGASIAFDDFDAGESSLALVRQVRPSWVGIEASRFAHLDAAPAGRALLASMTGGLRELGATPFAGGIDSPALLDFMLSSGIRHVRGDLFGKPVGAGEFVLPGPHATSRFGGGRSNVHPLRAVH
ncbi:MAG: EAL domain-containing protein [Rhizobiaceae bacterium]|nr:EAL domain-containing protein [Rhizobiaceae bacterium]MCV0407994.1 EAL domain-containing protein [Rhizobiaceae bacterium]